MSKRILYHGTSAENARLIAKEGFITDKKHNWRIKSKPGFVYLSTAYAPFYAMTAENDGVELAIIKVEVDTKDLYPEDDFLMGALGLPTYTQEQLDQVDLEAYKHAWPQSLKYMGNAAAKPNKVKILGIREFNGKMLVMKCDPVISPLNFKIMGDYYKELTEWLYEGKPVMEFKTLADFFKEAAEA